MRTLCFLFCFLSLVSCATNEPRGTDIRFHRKASPDTPVIVRLRWNPNEGPPFYTPRGRMTEISVSEAGRSVAMPAEKIAAIEDIWPERVAILSPRQGDYDLMIPSGVGEGSTDTFRFRDFQLARDANPLDPSQALQRK